MIYLIQNDREYDYDVRAIALAFYERTKIVEVTKEEFEEQEWEKDDLLYARRALRHLPDRLRPGTRRLGGGETCPRRLPRCRISLTTNFLS